MNIVILGAGFVPIYLLDYVGIDKSRILDFVIRPWRKQNRERNYL